MARLPALVNSLARTDGRPRVTLEVIARAIREAGLIATTQRGEGAAHMTVRDAANFLIGANAVQSPKLAADAARQFRTLKQTPHGRGGTGVFGELGACPTFGEAAELLIAKAEEIDLVFYDWTRRAFGEERQDEWRLIGPTLSVTFTLGVEIAVHFPSEDGPRLGHFFRFLADAGGLFDRSYGALDIGPDRRVATTIGLPTLCALHDCIFDLIRDPAAEDGTC